MSIPVAELCELVRWEVRRPGGNVTAELFQLKLLCFTVMF